MANTWSRLNGSPDPSLPAHARNAHLSVFTEKKGLGIKCRAVCIWKKKTI
jgi:hypothetical protein